MTVFNHEMRRGRNSLIIWTTSVAFMLIICVIMYPQMESQMQGVSDMFANMGSFSAAFGMNEINFGTPMGFYAVECGNILGIGGAFYAAIIAISALSKEEKERTAEFLFTHPLSRTSIITQKLCSVLCQLIIFNVTCAGFSYLSYIAIDESLPTKQFLLFHLAYFILQLEIAGICFGASAFVKGGGIGIGIGIATILYFMNILINISKKAEFIKYITPFAYTNSTDIIIDEKLEIPLILAGVGYMIIGIIAAYIVYNKKDIRA